MVQCGVPAVTKFIPAGIPQLSDPSPRYYRNIHTHTRRKPADSAGFPPSPSLCSAYRLGTIQNSTLFQTKKQRTAEKELNSDRHLSVWARRQKFLQYIWIRWILYWEDAQHTTRLHLLFSVTVLIRLAISHHEWVSRYVTRKPGSKQ